MAALKGGSSIAENAAMLREVLCAGTHSDARRDAVLLNAGVGNYVFGLRKSIVEGVELARETLNAGKGLDKLDEWLLTSARCSEV